MTIWPWQRRVATLDSGANQYPNGMPTMIEGSGYLGRVAKVKEEPKVLSAEDKAKLRRHFEGVDMNDLLRSIPKPRWRPKRSYWG